MNDKECNLVLALVSYVVVFFVGLGAGSIQREYVWKNMAVKAGAAEWVASDSGSAEFRWKTSAAQSAEGE